VKGWRIGRIAGISIEIHFTWLVIFGLILYKFSTDLLPSMLPDARPEQLWIAGLATAILAFGSLLLHELAHSLMAQRLGATVSRITLFILGGVAQMTREPKNPASEFKISIVGPLSSILLGGGFIGAYWAITKFDLPKLWAIPCLLVGEINIALAVFNMLPAFPLDGGRVLRSILWWRWRSRERATRIASAAGRWLGYLMMGLGVVQLIATDVTGGLWTLALGWLLSTMATASYQRVQLSQALDGVHVHDLMTSPVATIPAAVPLQRAVFDYFLVTGFATLAVEENGEIVGVLHRDQIQAVDQSLWLGTSVAEVMRPLDRDKMTVRADEDAVEALMKMAESGLERLLVVDWRGTVIGIITQSDVVRLLKMRGELRP